MKHAFPQLGSEHLNGAATYFISDLHLSDQTPEINQAFYTFLETVAPKADAIYILGDFLDAWVGDDTPALFLETLITACQQAAQHTKLYFLRGNRDFLFSDKLLKACGISRLHDPSTITLYNKRIAVCHGDHLCGRDIAHLFLRGVSQLRFMRWLFVSLPLSARLKIAGQLRSESTRRILDEPLVKFDVTEGRVLKTFRKSKTDRLIHGHTHRPHHHTHTLPGGKPADRFVMGCWGGTGIVLRHSKQGVSELLKWDPQGLRTKLGVGTNFQF
jgi:UDP-2,3-diacylglucosamine hydrolase